MKQWFQNLPRLRISPVLILLTALLLAIQLICGTLIPSLGTDEFYQHVGLSPHNIKSGKMWTLVTYALFHHPQHLGHVALNSIMLLYYGGRITHIFGLPKALQLIGLGVLAGGLCQLMYALLTGDLSFLIGISGGNFALLAAYLTFAGESRFCGIKGTTLNPLLTIVTFLLILVASGLQIPPLPQLHNLAQNSPYNILQISHPCHLGGLIIGWLTAWKMIRITAPHKKSRKQ